MGRDWQAFMCMMWGKGKKKRGEILEIRSLLTAGLQLTGYLAVPWGSGAF